jgi:putative RNA 2'-phosphotransferase
MLMDEATRTRISKFLSKHLRHAPEDLGISLASGGWVAVEELLTACARHNFPITREQLHEVVTTNNKQRFAFDATGTQIRANQGHSVAIDLQLAPATPPPVLYHGTSATALAAIKVSGLQKMARHQVHLSADITTAQIVGRRHGAPVVLAIDTVAMQRAGYTFYQAANGVWLVADVPPQYFKIVDVIN